MRIFFLLLDSLGIERFRVLLFSGPARGYRANGLVWLSLYSAGVTPGDQTARGLHFYPNCGGRVKFFLRVRRVST